MKWFFSCALAIALTGCSISSKQKQRSTASYNSTHGQEVEVYRTTVDTELKGDLTLCHPSENCKYGTKNTILKAGQLVWVSGWTNSSRWPVITYVKDFERGLGGSGTLDPAIFQSFQKVEACTVSQVIRTNSCD